MTELAKSSESQNTRGATAGEDLRIVVRNFLTPIKVLVSAAVYAGRQLGERAHQDKAPEPATRRKPS